MEQDSDAIEARLSSVLGPVDYRTDVVKLHKRLANAGALTRRRLVEMAAGLLRDSGVLEAEHSRVLMARLLVALLPDSMEIIGRLLSDTQPDVKSAEMHFSLFVALEELPRLSRGTLLSEVIPFIERYLLEIREEAAEAAWMAGDLLGDHWPLAIGLPVLVRATREATHDAGREGAIHGLSHALGRVDTRGQWDIIQVLRRVADSDSSDTVRRYADSVVTDLRSL